MKTAITMTSEASRHNPPTVMKLEQTSSHSQAKDRRKAFPLTGELQRITIGCGFLAVTAEAMPQLPGI